MSLARPQIVSWNLIRQVTGFSADELRSVAERAGGLYESRDRLAHKAKKPKWRHIDDPVPELKRIQRALVRGLLRPIPLPAFFCGSVSGRSPVDAIKPHVGRPSILALDLRDFFPRTSHKRVYRAWTRVVGCSPEIAGVLTQLTTLHRRLPQGAPSSPPLANLAFLEIGLAIESACRNAGLRVTFFVDDILISGDQPGTVLDEIIDLLQQSGYGVKRSKMEFMGPRERHAALGAVFNRFISYGRGPFAIIRQRILALIDSAEVTPSQIRSLTGAAHYVRFLNKNQGDKLLALIVQLRPTVEDGPREPKAQWETCRGGNKCKAKPRGSRPLVTTTGS
ncbi:MAG: RNA-directed DNA polymerase [Planctomycetes bacterium]|nr:RNA-directed DNA polymerase [Planctomycetota bacterium]